LLEWQPPLTDGGTPILGYSVSMRAAGSGSYITIYEGKENPGTRRISITSFQGAPLQSIAYQVKIQAYNWVGVSPDSDVALTLIVPNRAFAALSAVTGPVFLVDGGGAHTGIAETKAAVPAEVGLQARDAAGLDMTVGGSNAFVVIREHCTVTDNYRCDPVPGTPPILDGPVYQRMDDSNDGKYSTTINPKRPGKATLWAELTQKGGFYGEYFNNAFLDGVPAKK